MRHRTFIGLLALLLIAACGDVDVDLGRDVDGSGTVITETREVSDFERITLAGEGSVIVTVGEPASLSIETDDNLLQHIETTVRGNTLVIETEDGIDIDPSDSVIYRVSTRELTGLTLAGAGDFDVASADADSFSITLSGAGDVNVGALTAPELDVEISGAGRVELAGDVSTLDVTLTGIGNYEGADLRSARADVSTTGAGSATVWATDDLSATITGVGSIDYYGSPQVTQTVTGVGTISGLGDK